ncbi:MAG: endonuclease III [Candidatus Omnitrophota bacterium]
MNKIIQTIKLIEKHVRKLTVPIVTIVSDKWHDPYLVLISCILSLRTQDKTTAAASNRLFEIADSPRKMIKLPKSRLQKIIYPVGFYRTKTGVILELSKRLIKEYNGKVPASETELLKFKGVGRKTANLVLGLGFGIPAICVDTHVHRIPNRLGWVRTRTPEETEYALRKILPKGQWIKINTTLVTFGQNTCLPVSPLCSQCPVSRLCRKTGVQTHR